MLNLLFRPQRAPLLTDRTFNLLNQEVVIVNDVEPGCSGQALLAGVYWRCRTTSKLPIRAGQRAQVVNRESTTLWVLPT